MNKPQITKEFLTAGRARFLVSNPSGLQYTFQIKFWESKKTGRVLYFVSAQERSQWMEFVKMGTLNTDDWLLEHDPRSEIDFTHPAIAIFNWAVSRIVNEMSLPEGYSIRHCGVCGACGRPLSVEESVIRGIGPVCYGKAVERANRARIRNHQEILPLNAMS